MGVKGHRSRTTQRQHSGRLALRGRLEFTPRLTMIKEATVMGTALWNASEAETTGALAGVTAKLGSGALVPVVGEELPLREAAVAHRRILESGARGKLILMPDQT